MTRQLEKQARVERSQDEKSAGFPISAPVGKVENRGAKCMIPLLEGEVDVEKLFESSCVGIGKDRVISFLHMGNATKKIRRKMKKREDLLKNANVPLNRLRPRCCMENIVGGKNHNNACVCNAHRMLIAK